jgi:hypothetical protein
VWKDTNSRCQAVNRNVLKIFSFRLPQCAQQPAMRMMAQGVRGQPAYTDVNPY